jgi:uncharacterized metal-binding protein YceD (DUF177 family)
VSYDTKKIGKKGIGLSEDLDISIPRAFGAGEATVVSFTGRLTHVAQTSYVLEGQANCLLETPCCRCLKTVETPVSFAVLENFLEAGKGEPSDEDIIFSDDIISILPAIQRNLYNNIPMKFVCSDDCKGLSACCGINLNYGECECTEIREEFAALFGKFD